LENLKKTGKSWQEIQKEGLSEERRLDLYKIENDDDNNSNNNEERKRKQKDTFLFTIPTIPQFSSPNTCQT
jgi:hypothetical protein